jgi:hypothetical protein
MHDRSRGWLFACPDDVAKRLDLDLSDAPRRISHSPGAKKPRPAVSESEPPDQFGPEVWERILSRLQAPARVTFLRSNAYGSARLYRVNDDATDYLATWTPQTADDWSPTMDAIAHKLVEDFADDAHWRPLHGGAAGALLHARGCALKAKSADGAAAGLYYYWYVPLGTV